MGVAIAVIRHSGWTVGLGYELFLLSFVSKQGIPAFVDSHVSVKLFSHLRDLRKEVPVTAIPSGGTGAAEHLANDPH